MYVDLLFALRDLCSHKNYGSLPKPFSRYIQNLLRYLWTFFAKCFCIFILYNTNKLHTGVSRGGISPHVFCSFTRMDWKFWLIHTHDQNEPNLVIHTHESPNLAHSHAWIAKFGSFTRMKQRILTKFRRFLRILGSLSTKTVEIRPQNAHSHASFAIFFSLTRTNRSFLKSIPPPSPEFIHTHGLKKKSHSHAWIFKKLATPLTCTHCTWRACVSDKNKVTVRESRTVCESK